MKFFFKYYIPILFIPKKGNILGFEAYNFGFIIICNSDFQNDLSIVNHELKHSEQFFKSFGAHIFLYYFSKKYRYKAELAAYKVSVQYGMIIENAATMLINCYNVNISKEQCLKDLQN